MIHLLSPQASAEIAAGLREGRKPRPNQRRRDLPLVWTPGQPIPVTNNSSSTCPPGGLVILDGSAGADALHFGVAQPSSSNLTMQLLVMDFERSIAAGKNGMAWPMDGCNHCVYDPSGVCTVGATVGPQASSFAPAAVSNGPILVTAAAVTGPWGPLAQGLCNGASAATDPRMVLCKNTASSTMPIGGLGQLTGAVTGSGLTAALNLQQPLYPGISATLVVAVANIAAGATGYCWMMDGCQHPINADYAMALPGQRMGATGGSWYPSACSLGPITITNNSSIFIPAPPSGGHYVGMGVCHGQRGDCMPILLLSGSGNPTWYFPKTIIWGSNYYVTTTAGGGFEPFICLASSPYSSSPYQIYGATHLMVWAPPSSPGYAPGQFTTSMYNINSGLSINGCFPVAGTSNQWLPPLVLGSGLGTMLADDVFLIGTQWW